MQPNGALVETIPYRQQDEPAKKAAILRVGFNLDGLTPDEIQVLGDLVEAADAVNPIFRHWRVTYMLRRGVPIDQVQRFLNHRSIRTTQLYAKTVEREVDAAGAKTSPISPGRDGG